MSTVDAVVVGAGHNGLIAACYLARAGRHVVVLEQLDRAGGGARTEETVPGYRYDLHSVAHNMINMTDIPAELDLEGAGLVYQEMTRSPWRSTPMDDVSGSSGRWKPPSIPSPRSTPARPGPIGRSSTGPRPSCAPCCPRCGVMSRFGSFPAGWPTWPRSCGGTCPGRCATWSPRTSRCWDGRCPPT